MLLLPAVKEIGVKAKKAMHRIAIFEIVHLLLRFLYTGIDLEIISNMQM